MIDSFKRFKNVKMFLKCNHLGISIIFSIYLELDNY